MTYAVRRMDAHRALDDIDARIHAHIPLVRRLAWHVHGRISSGAELEELIQAGMVALCEAAQSFEDRGFEFSTYASMRIKGAMIDHLRRGSGQSRNAAASRRAIETARRDIESTAPGAATAKMIASRMQVSLDAYYRMESDAVTGTHEPLDDVYADDNIVFRDERDDQETMLDRATREERLRDALLELDERSRTVLNLYFFEEMNLEEIGQVLNVGAARICQIKKAALAQLQGVLG